MQPSNQGAMNNYCAKPVNCFGSCASELIVVQTGRKPRCHFEKMRFLRLIRKTRHTHKDFFSFLCLCFCFASQPSRKRFIFEIYTCTSPQPEYFIPLRMKKYKYNVLRQAVPRSFSTSMRKTVREAKNLPNNTSLCQKKLQNTTNQLPLIRDLNQDCQEMINIRSDLVGFTFLFSLYCLKRSFLVEFATIFLFVR